MLRFLKIWSTSKNHGKESMDFYINGKKNLTVISALKGFNNHNKIVKEGSRIPNIIDKHFATVRNRLANNLPIPQKHHLNHIDECKSSISFFQFQPVLSKELQKYNLYQMINLMVYTHHLPNYTNVQVLS